MASHTLGVGPPRLSEGLAAIADLKASYAAAAASVLPGFPAAAVADHEIPVPRRKHNHMHVECESRTPVHPEN